MNSISLNATLDISTMYKTRSILYQIYKNIRCLLRYNPFVRASLNLETAMPGMYTIDVAFGLLDKMFVYCETNGYTYKRLKIMIGEMNQIEIMIRDILQYFSYFIRPEFYQKPDLEHASERYKEMADRHTIDELKAIVGKNHLIDFEELGSAIDTSDADFDREIETAIEKVEQIDHELQDEIEDANVSEQS